MILALLLALPAQAAEQALVYDLSVEGAAVGTREVTIKYLSRPSGERHVLESFTHIEAAGMVLESRGSGLSTPTTAQFSSITERSGTRSAVAAQELPEGGWQVTVTSGGKQTERGEPNVRLSTLDLMDPGRVGLLAGAGTFGLVIAETGDVVTGTLGEGEPTTVKVGGQAVEVTRYALTGGNGTARFFVDADGLLVRSEVLWLGMTMIGSLRDLPPARDYGVVETIEGLSGGVKEGDL